MVYKIKIEKTKYSSDPQKGIRLETNLQSLRSLTWLLPTYSLNFETQRNGQRALSSTISLPRMPQTIQEAEVRRWEHNPGLPCGCHLTEPPPATSQNRHCQEAGVRSQSWELNPSTLRRDVAILIARVNACSWSFFSLQHWNSIVSYFSG